MRKFISILMVAVTTIVVLSLLRFSNVSAGMIETKPIKVTYNDLRGIKLDTTKPFDSNLCSEFVDGDYQIHPNRSRLYQK